jgi:predicted transcriptional regulator
MESLISKNDGMLSMRDVNPATDAPKLQQVMSKLDLYIDEILQ